MPEKKEKKPLSPLETAARMLTRRPLSRIELKKKLADKGFSWTVAESTVQECERLGFVNDASSAASAVTMMRDRKDGVRKIRMRLRMRGFSAEDVESGFAADGELYERDELSVATGLLQSRLRTLLREENLFKRRNKALGILANRGFSPDTAFQAIDAVLGENSREIPDEEPAP